jgi:hypothetical protein
MGIDRQSRAALEERRLSLRPSPTLKSMGKRNQMTTESEMKQPFWNTQGWNNQGSTQPTTKTCWQCQTEIDRKVRVCPHCRGKQTSNERKAVLWVVCIIGVLMAIGSAGGSKSTSTAPVQTEAEARYEAWRNLNYKPAQTETTSDRRSLPATVVNGLDSEVLKAIVYSGFYEANCKPGTITVELQEVFGRMLTFYSETEKTQMIAEVGQQYQQLGKAGFCIVLNATLVPKLPEMQRNAKTILRMY